MIIPPLRLVLSGGGVKVTALVGVLHGLHERGLLKNLKEVCGISAGAWLGLFLAARVPMDTLEKIVMDLDFSVIRNLNADAFLGFPETFGLDDGTKFVKFLESVCRVVLKLDPATTFEDFAAAGNIGFRCWATDLTGQCGREFSLKATPNVKIIDALRASMALPMYFTPVSDPITGHVLSDGGIMGNLGMYHLTKEELEVSLGLGFCIDPANVGNNKTPAADSLLGFMYSITCCLAADRTTRMLQENKGRILLTPVDEYPSWNFEISREDRLMLIKKGKEAAHAWLENRPLRDLLKRRQSI